MTVTVAGAPFIPPATLPISDTRAPISPRFTAAAAGACAFVGLYERIAKAIDSERSRIVNASVNVNVKREFAKSDRALQSVEFYQKRIDGY